MIPLWLSVFDWALCRRSKGAVKLHLVLDHEGWLPQFAVVTTGKTAKIEVARRQRFEPGAMLEIEGRHMNMPLGRSNCGRSNSCSRGRKRSLSESTAEVPAEAERAGGPGWEGSA